jgi:hypothetical protein
MRSIDLTEYAAAGIDNAAVNIIKSKDEILQKGYGYLVVVTILLAAMFIVVVGGSLFGLCQAVKLGQLCNWSSTARIAFIFVNALAILFWALYYFTLREQQAILDQINPSKFFSEDIKQKLNSLSLSASQLFIIANVCSIPIYLLVVLISFRLVGLLINWSGIRS